MKLLKFSPAEKGRNRLIVLPERTSKKIGHDPSA